MLLGSCTVKVRDGSDKGRSNFLEGSSKAAQSMPANAILQEATKLHKVSDSLDLLAIQHAPIAEALSILAGSVRNSATLLEVLVALKLGTPPELKFLPN
jgi:hypothetical protein